MKALDLITGALVVIGGLNWGLVALAEFDLVAEIVGLTFGETNTFSRIVYALVGLSALYQAYSLYERAQDPAPVGTTSRTDEPTRR